MAEQKTLFSKVIDAFKPTSDATQVKQLLDKVTDLEAEMQGGDAKFFEAETSSFAQTGEFQFGGIDQTINDAMLQRLYVTEPWVYIPITAIAKTIAGLPIQLEKQVKTKRQIMNDVTGQTEEVMDEEWVEASGEKLFQRFQYPNKFTTQTEFMMLLMIDLLTTGNYYIYLDSDEDLDLIANADFDDDPNSSWGRIRSRLAADTKIKGMYRIPPPLIKPVMDEEGPGIVGYMMESEHGQFAFKCAEIIHVKLPNPLNQYTGLAPLIPALKPILLDRYTTENMIRFYKTGMRLGSVVETEKNLNKEQLSRFQRSLENNYTGRQNFHRTLVLPPGMKLTQMDQNPAETSLLEFCKNNRETMLAVFNVPPIKVGIMDHANYANALVQLKIFFTDTIKPYLSFIEDGFNLKNTLLPDTKTFRFKFDLSEVEALKENNKEMADTAKIMIDAGLSVNEVRKRIWNAGPTKDGEKVKVIEDMSNKTQPFPLFNARGAEAGETKDAVSGSPTGNDATIESDVKPTGITYSQRVAQLTELYMQRDKLPLSEAIRRAVEQAITEGFDPEDPNDPPKGSSAAPAPNSPGPSAPAKEAQAAAETTQAPVNNVQVAQTVKPVVYAFGLSKDQVVDEWKSFIGKMDPLIEKREAEVRKFFKGFRSIVMNKLGANVKAYGLHKARNNEDADDIVNVSNFDDLVKEYVAQIDAVLLDAYKNGYTDTLTTFKFDPRNEVALEQLRKYAGDKIQGIVDTTRDQIKQILTDSFDEGVAVNEVSQRLNEKFAEITTGRASTIARTETLTAVSMGREAKRDDFQKEFPDKQLKKMWVSAQDDKVRDSHQDLDGEVRDADGEFKAGLKFPRDPDCSDASEVINCRCTDITYAEEDQDKIDQSLSDQQDE